ncbi:hypothetical protein FHP24_06050 [Aliirhizobium smilacinae]|uniref:Peptidase S8/S53 domain-containing protein n=1 Tax=Aliirhizobium smilacinae TaxID=1395944 RepID=A0A5C4XR82_9HYPH|nr:S8 family serine peptidase [Rhizobium smilacinae]TNM65799.1 hypothetical protein FHP24_06050 [Rhizobium smilacinae]
MMGNVLALAPEEFVRVLAKQSSIWRRSGGFAGKRHRRNLRRRWIRLYKSKRGIQSLAQYGRPEIGILASDIEVSPESSIILLLPDNRYLSEQSGEPDSDIGRKTLPLQGTSVNSRRELRRLIHSAMASRSKTTLDLINASHTYRQSLPSVARVRHGKRLALRGVYLEALGIAILPRLEQPMIEILQKQGAEVLTNSEILVSAPDTVRLETPPDFWHRRILPNAGAEPQDYRGKGISIGILDTGIDPDHPEFSHKDIVYSEFDENGILVENAPKRDFGTHGTHVAGICVGHTAGIAPDAHLSVAGRLDEHKRRPAAWFLRPDARCAQLAHRPGGARCQRRGDHQRVSGHAAYEPRRHQKPSRNHQQCLETGCRCGCRDRQ